ncbi:hypothetical protein A6A25_30610 [Saccharothrix sp. CB00851]|nr:hypothetical protein A6A25_30610 [Saccharothrix sp. CB00851]
MRCSSGSSGSQPSARRSRTTFASAWGRGRRRSTQEAIAVVSSAGLGQPWILGSASLARSRWSRSTSRGPMRSTR